MNYWTEKSIRIGNSDGYLDNLFKEIYKIENKPRKINNEKISKIKDYFYKKDKKRLLNELLSNEIFPFEDPCIGYLRKSVNIHTNWYEKNPILINEILDKLFAFQYDQLKKSLLRPKKLNQQIGPSFKNWIEKVSFFYPKTKIKNYKSNLNNCILTGSDDELKLFAKNHLGYTHNKGLDFIAKSNDLFIIGEAKLITDSGGNQNKSLEDVDRLLNTKLKNTVTIAILDGVVYLKDKGKLFNYLNNSGEDKIILSAFLINDFLKQFKNEE